MNNDVFHLLRCPEDHSTLLPASEGLIAQLNDAIAEHRLINRAGHVIDQPLDGGLVRASRDLLYPIFDQIPVMLVDEAIRLDQVSSGSAAS